MQDRLITLSLLAALIFIMLVGGGVLVWLAPVPADRITPAQDNLINISDWLVKASAGAILGFAGARFSGGRKGGDSR